MGKIIAAVEETHWFYDNWKGAFRRKISLKFCGGHRNQQVDFSCSKAVSAKTNILAIIPSLAPGIGYVLSVL